MGIAISVDLKTHSMTQTTCVVVVVLVSKLNMPTLTRFELSTSCTKDIVVLENNGKKLCNLITLIALMNS